MQTQWEKSSTENPQAVMKMVAGEMNEYEALSSRMMVIIGDGERSG